MNAKQLWMANAPNLGAVASLTEQKKTVITMDEIKDFEVGNGFEKLIEQYSSMGFQASHLGEAASLIEKMKAEKTTIFFGFTANLVASGMRGIIRDLCKARFVDVIVTTAGAIEHDIMKNHKDYLLGSFSADDVELHKKGINRIGNIFVPTERYIYLEKFMQKIFAEMNAGKKIVTVREMTRLIGEKLGEDSFLYWCAKNNIPIFCPGITDGAIGLNLYFYKQEHKDFCIDITGDMKELADITLNADKTSAIILGGGITKHHIIGVNILREGLDYAAYFTTAQEYDGSLSGAQTREAKSWGKISEKGKSVTVYGDATTTFPLIAGYLMEKGLI